MLHGNWKLWMAQVLCLTAGLGLSSPAWLLLTQPQPLPPLLQMVQPWKSSFFLQFFIPRVDCCNDRRIILYFWGQDNCPQAQDNLMPGPLWHLNLVDLKTLAVLEGQWRNWLGDKPLQPLNFLGRAFWGQKKPLYLVWWCSFALNSIQNLMLWGQMSYRNDLEALDPAYGLSKKRPKTISRHKECRL